jgi:hypothetical protein
MIKLATLIFLMSVIYTPLIVAQRKAGTTHPTGQITLPRTGRLLSVQSSARVNFMEYYHGIVGYLPSPTPPPPAYDSVDLSPYIPKIPNQPYFDCYAYASAYAGRTILYNITHNIREQPDCPVFSTTFLQKVAYHDNSACQTNGYDTYKACQILRDTGIVFQSDFPADDCSADDISPAMWHKALLYRVNATLVYSACDPAETKVEAIRASLLRRHPVVVAWCSVDSFNQYGDGVPCWKPDIADYRVNACRDSSNHAFCIIGYNDRKFGGAFQIMNSWGTDWGIGGLMWITYKDMAQFSAFGIELSNRYN